MGFEAYVAARGRSLLRFAFVLSRDADLAQDLVQNALGRVHSRWERLETPDAYLRRAIVNDFLSWKRRGASREVLTAELPDVAAEGTGLEDRDSMWRLLGELPRKQRVVLVLRFYEDLDDEQIARVLGCAPATVRSHASQALAALRANSASVRFTEGTAR